ncbi:MAG: hypothetical protein HY662_00785 [Chloroflexi bacterium]|nr:hypothetical protein [Chloroflexota bacterium]
MITRTGNYLSLPTIYFPGATPIIPVPGFTPSFMMTETGLSQLIVWTSQNSTLQMTQLVWTGANSWLEANFTSSATPEFNEGTDKKGPLPLALLVTDSKAAQGTGPR